jgi:hypothetical protein
VRRDPDRAGAVLDAALDRLADPERRVGRELVALAPVELLGGAHEAEDALLDEVEQRQVVGRVLLGQRDDERRFELMSAPWPSRSPRSMRLASSISSARSAAGSCAAR